MVIRIIPVIDVKGGAAVLARGGDRAHYAPVRSILHQGDDPAGLAHAYRDRLGVGSVYLADLDAIAGAAPSVDLYRRVADLRTTLWVDAGIRSARDVAPLLEAGASVVIAGLETVRGPEMLGSLVDLIGADRLAFSLDLRDGAPLGTWGMVNPREIAAIAIDLGITRVIVLDLARVGPGRGRGHSAVDIGPPRRSSRDRHRGRRRYRLARRHESPGGGGGDGGARGLGPARWADPVRTLNRAGRGSA